MDKIARLRQEIERRKNICESVFERGSDTYYQGKAVAYGELLSFLDTLSEEPDKSLEEAAYKYSFDSRPSIYGQVDVIDAFKAGAEWQASRMPMPEDTVLFNKGVQEGRRLEREDMMKDVVEGVAHPDDCEIWVNLVGYGYKFNDGDKVRIVVLKEEDEK